jgi:hypothetical protein
VMNTKLKAAPLGVGALIVSLTLTLGAMTLSASPQTPPEGSFQGINLDRPFVNGVRFASLSDAAAKAGGVAGLPRPDDPEASDQLIRDVWVDDSADGTLVRIDYETGIYVQIEPAPESMMSSADAQSRYEAMAKEDSASTQGLAQVVMIGSTPAYLIPQNAAVYANGESQHAAGAVTFVIGKHIFNVVGAVSDDELLRITSSTTTAAAQG